MNHSRFVPSPADLAAEFVFEVQRPRQSRPLRPGGAGKPWDYDEQGEVPGALSDRDFIDSRIDVDAQRALLSMASSSNLARVNAAFDILALVKGGVLAGIYKPDQRVPAMLVRSRGSNWWETIRPGTDSRLLCHSPGKALLVFRKNLSREELIGVLMALDAMGPRIMTFCSPGGSTVPL